LVVDACLFGFALMVFGIISSFFSFVCGDEASFKQYYDMQHIKWNVYTKQRTIGVALACLLLLSTSSFLTENRNKRGS